MYVQTDTPIDASSLTRWRHSIGKEGVETLLMATIEGHTLLETLEQSRHSGRSKPTTAVVDKATRACRSKGYAF